MTNPEIAFTNEGYTAWIESLSTRYRESQIKAAVSVNAEMLKFYFGLGRDIVMMGKDQPWGSGFLKRVSVDLKTKMPDADCFSPTNLGYMRRFFELYAHVIYPQLGGEIESREISNLEKPIYPQVGDELDTLIFQVPWGHHKCLIDKFLHEPIGVSEYRISEILPKEIESDLPSIADIESAVGGALPTTP